MERLGGGSELQHILVYPSECISPGGSGLSGHADLCSKGAGQRPLLLLHTCCVHFVTEWESQNPASASETEVRDG